MAGWCSRDVIHIRWTSTRKSAILRTIVLALFDYRLMKHYKFSITFKSEILLGQSKTPTASRRSRSLVFAVWCMALSCMNMAGPATDGCQGVPQPWTSSKFHQAVMFALDLDQWQFAITGKIPQHRDGSVGVDMSSLDTGRMEMFKGTFLTPSGFAL